MPSEKCKLKQDNTTHLLEQPKSKTPTSAHADQDVEQQELSLTAGGNVNVVPKLNVLFLPHDLATAPLTTNSGTEKLYPHKILHMRVLSSFIHNYQNL